MEELNLPIDVQRKLDEIDHRETEWNALNEHNIQVAGCTRNHLNAMYRMIQAERRI